MGSKESTEAYLRGPGKLYFEESMANARTAVLAQELRRHLDVSSGLLADSSRYLDDLNKRLAFLTSSSELLSVIVESFVKRDREINAFLKTQGVPGQSRRPLRATLGVCCSILLKEPACQVLLGATPFPAVWEELANLLARELYELWSSGTQDEWLVHNYSLLSGYFLTCRIPQIRLVCCTELGNKQDNSHGIRGSLLRLVERVDAHGILDVLPDRATRSGLVSLRNAHLSSLLTAVEKLANAVPNILGPIQSQFNNGKPPAIPTNVHPAVTPNLALAGRREMMQQYDYTVLGHMALAAIEQMLRTWAEHATITHHDKGVPLNLEKWLPSVACSTALRKRLDDLYDAKKSNLRNRSNHGGLLEAETLRMETALQLLQGTALVVNTSWNRYSPENVAALCFECLEMIDREAPSNLTGGDLKWIADFAPTKQELQKVANSNTDLLDPYQADEWRRRIVTYVRATAPAASIFCQVGYVGWLEHAFDVTNNLAKLYALVLVFETIFRNTLHTMGASVLQISAQAPDGLKINYLMLDETHGLCTEDNIRRLLNDLPVEQHAAATVYLNTAVKIRNALAHGAVLNFDEHLRDNMGHCLLKTIQLLMHAGRTHMTREYAYYRWRWRNSDEDRALEDWLIAQNASDAFFQRFEIHT